MQEIMQFFNRHPILGLIWVGLVLAVVYTLFKSLVGKVKEINRAAAIQLINKEEAVVIDLRSREEFRKGHIVNSINLTPADIKAGNLGELSKKAAYPLIVACLHGTSSRTSAEALIKEGFAQVYVLKEGISGWQGDNMPLIKGK